MLALGLSWESKTGSGLHDEKIKGQFPDCFISLFYFVCLRSVLLCVVVVGILAVYSLCLFIPLRLHWQAPSKAPVSPLLSLRHTVILFVCLFSLLNRTSFVYSDSIHFVVRL